MNNSLIKITEDLIKFYVKSNYEKYLKDHKIKSIEESKIEQIIDDIFQEKLEHLRFFIVDSVPKLYSKNDTPPTSSVINNLLNDIFEDEKLCKLKLKNEIIRYQKK